MKKSKKNAKPTGKIGPIIINLEQNESQFEPITFPEKKEDLERFIFQSYMRGLGQKAVDFYKLISNPIQNKENDFDFSLPTESGTEFLDLMEVAPLDKVDGSYKDASYSYNHGEMVDWVFSKISSKSKKYFGSKDLGLHLLLYSTDWRFRLNESVLFFLAFLCSKNSPCFRTITYFILHDKTHGDAKIIFPISAKKFEHFNEKAARARKTIMGNPEKIQQEEGSAFSIPLGD